jgi:hypothetical protein
MFKLDKITPEMEAVLKLSASMDLNQSVPAFRQIIAAIVEPIQQGITDGDILGNIFDIVPFKPGVETRFPLDFFAPGTEGDYSAFTMPNTGYIPEKNVEGDYVVIPHFKVGVALDWSIQYAEDARWDVMARVMQAIEHMLQRKINLDGWRTIIGAGFDRNVYVNDGSATAGFLTKRLFSLLQLGMRRYGGGNSTSRSQFTVTDAFVSPECQEDIRNWPVADVDDITRREIYTAPGVGIRNVYGVDIHELFELGAGQVLQRFFESLGGTYPGSDTELIVGLCRNKVGGSSFVMPLVEKLKLYDDPTLLRSGRQGVFGWQRHGFGCLDNRNVLLATA